MHAVLITARMDAGDTEIDPAPRFRRRRMVLRRKPRSAEDAPETVRRVDAPPEAAIPAPERSASRLADLHVAESIVRRTARPRSRTVLEAPETPSVDRSACLVRIAWVRSEDAGLVLVQHGRDQLEIHGRATGVYTRGCARAPTSTRALGAPPDPAIAIGVDGLMYTARIRRGETPLGAAAKLAARLHRHFALEVLPLAGGGARIRLIDERRDTQRPVRALA